MQFSCPTFHFLSYQNVYFTKFPPMASTETCFHFQKNLKFAFLNALNIREAYQQRKITSKCWHMGGPLVYSKLLRKYSSMPQLCTSNAKLDGPFFHRQVMKCNFDHDSLVSETESSPHVYGKCGALASGKRATDEMPEEHVLVPGTALVSEHIGRGRGVVSPFSNVTQRGMPCIRNSVVYVKLLKNYSSMLQKCVSDSSLVNGRAVHGRVIKCGITPDSHLWSCLLNLYVKSNDICCARQLLSQMPQEDAVIGWHALINGLVVQGNGKEAVLLFNEMLKTGVQPNKFIYATILKACSMCRILTISKQMHGQVIKFGLSSFLYVGSALVDVYAKKGEMEIAKEVFVGMRQHNAVSWNSLLNGYVRIGNGREVLKLFCQMTDADIRMSKFTLSSVIKACADLGSVREGRSIHGLAIKIGSELDSFLSSSLIDMYSKCELADDAYKAFSGMEDPDVVAWSSIISCFDQCGYNVEATEVFGLMQETGVWPNEYTLSSLVSSATDLEDMRYGQCLHAYIIKSCFDSNNSVSNALVTMYMKSGHIQDGFKIFNALRDKDVVSWNALLLGFHDGSGSEIGWRIFNAMLLEFLKPNKYTFISVVRSCTSLLRLDQGKQAHAYIIKSGLGKDSFVGTTLVDLYAKCGDLDSACQVFARLNGRDVFTWTVMIAGYTHIDQGETALHIFCQMQREGIKANEHTFASCLKACSSLAALKSGCQVHALVTKMGILADGFVASSLIDMYGKCGCLKEFEGVFDEVTHRDVVLWNTIICGYTHHGLGPKALEAFQCMLAEGVWPDDITFIGVLSACSRGGLIKEGQRHFESLSKLYGLTPTIEHHACMVDILGRAAKFDEIEHFIANMPHAPNSLIWQTVLGACTVHGNVELGEQAAKKLFELEPHEDSTYILLSNIYAAKRRWGDVVKVRSMMQRKRVKKEPGCSWIEVDGQVHVFIPQDKSHPKTSEIYEKLEELGEELTSRGYIPRTSDVLHNVDEDEKKESLLYHSERLTLAFGLISTKPGRCIRIFKNLRICKDCHSAFKLLSDITEREIVVRDISRFHHFQNVVPFGHFNREIPEPVGFCPLFYIWNLVLRLMVFSPECLTSIRKSHQAQVLLLLCEGTVFIVRECNLLLLAVFILAVKRDIYDCIFVFWKDVLFNVHGGGKGTRFSDAEFTCTLLLPEFGLDFSKFHCSSIFLILNSLPSQQMDDGYLSRVGSRKWH
ncbi:hypothetical protein H6P81_019917 [Aristolochia fimbriata]|uniref:DYW domain-containing protein n=1 Tax=Aristolochia fimbriata TaxID=158543 RepID=A0AAV7DWZ8_ARIFI|nr:hypothetical protein H6P81_019917 [Aristolochia fimbriata]